MLTRVFVSTFFELLARLMLSPLLTLRWAARGEDPVVIGWLSASLFIAIIVATPRVPFIVKRSGLRLCYLVSGALPLAALALLFASDALLPWFVAV